MTAHAAPHAGEGQPTDQVGTNEKILFWASFLTLIAAGIGFSVRAAILGDWSKQFGFTQSELGTITGGGLVGFGLTIIFFSLFADRVGYGPLMAIAFLFHVSSAIVTLAAAYAFEAGGKGACYWCLYIGAFLFALGNGTCEAVINPLTATLYPRNKTHWLNILHAGWPGGLILGALLGLIFEQAKVRWEIQMATFLVPTALYGLLMFGRRFPHSEARSAGVTLIDMLRELGLLGAAVIVALLGLWLSTDVLPGLGVPGVAGWAVSIVLLLVFGAYSNFAMGHWMMAMLLLLHALVGYVELGTDSWISNITGTILENKQWGLILFIWTSGLMFALRFFAGPIVHQISPLGLLFVSAMLGCLGLFLLGSATGILICVVAATIYGVGKTFLWPTMLGVVAERFPRGGAITLGAVGGVGMLSAGLLGGPGIGYKQDYYASTELRGKSEQTFERYAARDKDGQLDKKGFLFFPVITGLDGSRVALALGDPVMGKDGKAIPGSRQAIQDDLEVLEKTGRKLADDKNLDRLVTWWDKEGKPHEEQDVPLVKEARLVGGKSALTTTALVPATMALGYLLLILYFRARGGYQAEVLTGHAAKDEEYTGGTVGPGEA
ncbi:MAG: MFS transporter [Gemmataceae bacterium]